MKKSTITRISSGIVAALASLATSSAVSAAQVPSTRAPVMAVASSLDRTDASGLVHMAEEEKLAHDVYVTLGKLWKVPVFANISASETRHLAAMRSLLATYGLSDPTKGKAVGAYSDPAFTALYNRLVNSGKASLAAALRVGVTIEQLDIDDLRTRLDQTDQADITATYQSLLRGSNNQLSAFNRSLSRL